MTWQALVVDIFERKARELSAVLDGLTPEDLDWRPEKGANSIGWLTWHLTRSLDRNLSDITGEEQLWISDGWYARFGREPDPGETGVGHDPMGQAEAFRSPDVATLLEYHLAALGRLRRYAGAGLTEAELERLARSPTLGTNWTMRHRLVGIVNDGLQHLGQAAYVRGLLKGAGWLGR